MATSFKDVYRRFLFSIEDDGIARLEKRDFYDLLENYLTTGASLDFKECKTSLEYIKGKSFENSFLGDGATREFLLYNTPNNEIIDNMVLIGGNIVDECFYIIVNDDENRVEGGFEIPEYSEDIVDEDGLLRRSRLNISNNEQIDEDYLIEHKIDKYIQFVYPVEEGKKVKVVLKELGYFKEDLTEEEVLILAETMKLHWIRKQITREDNLKASISTADFKKTSNANLLDKLLLLEERTQLNLKEYKVNYSMKGFEGFY